MPKREALEQEPSTGEHLIKAGLGARIDQTIRQRKPTQTAAKAGNSRTSRCVGASAACSEEWVYGNPRGPGAYVRPEGPPQY